VNLARKYAILPSRSTSAKRPNRSDLTVSFDEVVFAPVSGLTDCDKD
jgi:hypothetical protein